MFRREAIQKVIELGCRRGFVTFDELNELLPSDTTAPEHVETLFETLRHEGIDVTES
jgi:RNA polymerase primary sigma factor